MDESVNTKADDRKSGTAEAGAPGSSVKTDTDAGGEAPPASPMKRRVGRFFDVLSWVVLIALAMHLLFRDTGGPEVGSAAPEHQLVALETGHAQTLPPAGAHGPILIKAFASWCGACKRSVWIEDLTDLGESNDLQFVAVSVDDNIESARGAAKSWPIEGTVLFDAERRFSRDYDVQVLPTYILIDKNNQVVRVTSGLPGPLDIRAWKSAVSAEP